MARKEDLTLPVLVFGVSELRRLLRELSALENYLTQANLRQPGKSQSLPKASRVLDNLAGQNQLNLLHAEDRQTLLEFLRHIETQAPVLHFSFASDPSSAFMAKLVTWLRRNIHPNALVSLGLQPSIAAGCIVRTKNKSFDFSLRSQLGENYQYLAESIARVGSAPEVQK